MEGFIVLRFAKRFGEAIAEWLNGTGKAGSKNSSMWAMVSSKHPKR